MTDTFTMIIYDLPTNCRHSDGRVVESPVSAFRRRAVYLNNSVVMCKTHNVPHNLVASLIDARVMLPTGQVKESKVYTIPLGIMESTAFAQVALDCMQAKLAESEANQTASLARLLKNLEEFEADPTHKPWEIRRAQAKYAKDRANVLKRMDKLIRELQEGARACSVDTSTTGFSSLSDRVRQLRSGTNARCTMIQIVQDQLANTKGSEGLATSLEADEMPPEVALDALEDQGKDTTAARAVLNGASNAAQPTSVISGSNGHGNGNGQHTVPHHESVVGTQPETTYVVEGRNGRRSVVSTLTTRQAAQICETIAGSNFARDLADGYLNRNTASRSQRAWLQVMAVEELRRREEENQPAEQSQPAPVQLEASEMTAQEVVAAKVVASVPEFSTVDMAWNVQTRMLSVDVSTLHLEGTPVRINVRGPKGGVKEFTLLGSKVNDDNETLFTLYAALDGMGLTVYYV